MTEPVLLEKHLLGLKLSRPSARNRIWSVSAIISALTMCLVNLSTPITVYASPAISGSTIAPQVKDQNLKVELVGNGLKLPTSMTFIDDTSLLVTQKGGTVVLASIENATGTLAQNALIRFNVSTTGERGLLGVASIDVQASRDDNSTTLASAPANGDKLVFFYLTENGGNGTAIANRVYRYQFDNTTNTLSNKTLLISLPRNTDRTITAASSS